MGEPVKKFASHALTPKQEIIQQPGAKLFFAEGTKIEETRDHVKCIFYTKRDGVMTEQVAVVMTRADYEAALREALPRALTAAMEQRGVYRLM